MVTKNVLYIITKTLHNSIRHHQTEGIVEHGRKIGRKIGFPTANLARNSEGLLPVDGVYAGWLHSDGVRYPPTTWNLNEYDVNLMGNYDVQLLMNQNGSSVFSLVSITQ